MNHISKLQDTKCQGYFLNWQGRDKALADITSPLFGELTDENGIKTALKEGENIFIQGENLEGLKILSKTLREKIKIIYIDPPYNTGGDFVYNDKFNKKNGANHEAWLTMIYPRLYLAKDLLTKDGALFVSIDDNECHNLRIILNEIFGEENFVGALKWKRKKQPSFLHGHIASIMEYILVYAKDRSKLSPLCLGKRTDKNTRLDNQGNKISQRTFPAGIRVKLPENIDKIPKGIYQIKTMTVEYLNDIFIKGGRITNSGRILARFRDIQERIDDFCKMDLVFITKNYGLRRDLSPKEKERPKKISDLLLDWGDNQDASKELKELFGKKVFDYPKPVSLIKNIIKCIEGNESATVLDFFAGSCTTAQAVMELNSEDQEERNFICIQSEETLKNPIKIGEKEIITISQIGNERIHRAIEKISRQHKGFYPIFRRLKIFPI